MARTLSFIYHGFDANSFADMLEKRTLDKKRQASQKEHVLSSTAPFSSLDSIVDPIAAASPFGQHSLVRPLLNFHFWFASSNWSSDISMVQVHSYLKQFHQGRCLAVDQLSSQFFVCKILRDSVVSRLIA